jgi:glycosyltransferase involved in cell wall biosynthesis
MTSWLWEDNEERKEIDALLKKTIKYVNSNGDDEKFDLSIQVTIPNEWEKIAPINIGVTAGIETTAITTEWIEKSFLMDKIITISKHSMDIFVNTVYQATNNHSGETQDFKCIVPVEYVSYPVRKFDPKDIDLNLTTDFNFLTMAQLSPRKNVQQLIKCFVEKFGDNENVGLIVKANTAKNSLIDKVSTLNSFKQLLADYEDRKCKIYLLHGFLNDEEMAGLYTHPKIHAFVSTTHGEGFGLPLFESTYYGLPVIATDWSGHLDFLYKPVKQKSGKIKFKHMFERISYQLKPVEEEAVWDGVIAKESMWAYPEGGSIKMALDEVYRDHGRFVKRAKELQKWVCKEFTEKKKYEEFVALLDDYFLDENIDEFAFFNKENND